ncbi:MAG TPA: glucose 1-dehydrogenase [Gemmataceae bacterium]|jgi:gluconate 5-dehydrogenase|nr:glucose 1-dehydrogenase [Gemmataceae bacterium]
MIDNLFSVANQVTLISGGSRGIGRALAEGFAGRGARVIITGREPATLEQTAQAIGSGVRPMVCDVADSKAIKRLVDHVCAEFGVIDSLVNVAGVNRRMLAEKLSEDDYDFIMDINLKGPALLSLAVGKRMLERGQGNQINITSLNCDRPLKGVMPYAVSKAGLEHMTRSLAMEWGPRGVRVNAIAPGFVLTDLTKKLWSQPTMQQWGEANTPLKRLGQPADMVGAAVFLASAASAWMTGQTLYVDGGFSAGLVWPIDFGNQ